MSKQTLPVSGSKPTRYRYLIMFFLLGATFINYMDRAVLSVAAPHIQKEWGISNAQMGFLFSAFAWSIVVVILFSAVLTQRFGARLIGGIGLGGFSTMTLLTATSTSIPLLAFFRFGLGAFEAPTFPINSYLSKRWFPRRQRAKIVGVYMAGSFLGLAFAVPALTWMVGYFNSWQLIFVFTGVVGIIFAIFWFWLVPSDPSTSPFVNAAELRIIREQDAAKFDPPAKSKSAKLTWRAWRQVAFNRRLVGVYMGAFATSTVIFFFITWFPEYLTKQLNFNFKSGGFWLSALPYLAAIVGMLFAGWLSDMLIKKNMTPGKARKVTVTIGVAGVLLLLVVPFLAEGTSVWIIMPILLVAFFFAGMANTAWLLTAEIANPRLLGLTTGVYGFWVNLFGALTPVIVGLILQASGGSFGAVFGYVGAAAAVGVIGYVFVLDRVEPLPDPDRKSKVLVEG